VYVVAGGKAERREVRIGGSRPGSVEIVAGLSAGEQVVIEGTQKVRDGGAVRAGEKTADFLPGPVEAASHEASVSPASLRQ
jgi:membrane fusion protein (multidrug efflux system)